MSVNKLLLYKRFTYLRSIEYVVFLKTSHCWSLGVCPSGFHSCWSLGVVTGVEVCRVATCAGVAIGAGYNGTGAWTTGGATGAAIGWAIGA